MPEETTTTVVPTSPSNETTTVVVPTSPFNADGTFIEGWNKLAPEGYEDLHDDQTLPRLKNPWDLGRSYMTVRKQVPLDKMPRPNDNFSESDWADFHIAGGRPDTPGDYNITRPDEVSEELMTKEDIEGWQDFFHKIGASKKQVDAIAARNNEILVKAIKEQATKEENENNDLKDKLVVKWGRAYEQNERLKDKAIDKGIKDDEGLRERVTAKINADPDLIELVSNLGGMFGESSPIETPAIETPSDIKDQITKLMNDPRYTSSDKAIRMPLVNQVMRLREQMNKDMKLTG